MTDAIDIHVGMRLRLKRCTLGLSQRQLSERLNCAEARVASIENGHLRIGTAELFEIAKVLRVSVGWFYEVP